MGFEVYAHRGRALPSGRKREYVADEPLRLAVNVAIAAGQPLLVTGEPGVGKTLLARSIAEELGLARDSGEPRLHRVQVRSDAVARDALYLYDHLADLRDATAAGQRGDTSARERARYVTYVGLGAAIDEIDKAPTDFPNDLLHELDELKFEVSELRNTGDAAAGRWAVPNGVPHPVVVITSNSDRPLPSAFLRRCVYAHIDFPGRDRLREIVELHHPPARSSTAAPGRLLDAAVDRLVEVRKERLSKPPATGELIRWIAVLRAAGSTPEQVRSLPLWDLFPGALLKLKEDLDRFAPQADGA